VSQGGNFLLLNRPFYSVFTAFCGLVAFPVPLLAAATMTAGSGQTVVSSPARPQALPIPVCSLEGEIGQGKGRIAARGEGRGYTGELIWHVSETPGIVFTVNSEFVPHRPAVDRFTLSVDPEGRVPGETRLSGAFGFIEGNSFSIERSPDAAADQDRRWFDELASGATLTVIAGADTVAVNWPAESMDADYDLLLDLLQLVAGWEIAGLCLNEAPAL